MGIDVTARDVENVGITGLRRDDGFDNRLDTVKLMENIWNSTNPDITNGLYDSTLDCTPYIELQYHGKIDMNCIKDVYLTNNNIVYEHKGVVNDFINQGKNLYKKL